MPVATRYAIISDIHANLGALQAVLELAREYGVHKICCLGDIVGYAAAPAECLRLCREHCDYVVQGNHDDQVRPPRNPIMRVEAMLALDYAQQQLTEEEADWLKNLPHPVNVDGKFIAAHGALTGRDDYILKSADVENNLMLLEKNYPFANIMFFGHTHLPMVLTSSKAVTDLRQGGVLNIQPDTKYLINPGSVGQSRDGNSAACFCIYDTEDSQLIFVRAEYDIQAEQERIRSAGLPDKSAYRLALGK